MIHQDVYNEVLEKVVALTKTLTVGSPEDVNTYMGPVIGQASYNKIMKYIEIGMEEGKLMTGGEGDDSEGYFIQPTIIADVNEKARYAGRNIWSRCRLLQGT